MSAVWGNPDFQTLSIPAASNPKQTSSDAKTSEPSLRCYLAATRLTGGGGAAAGEMTNVSHVFQPVGRSEPPNSA